VNVVLFTGRFLPEVGGMEYAVHYLADALVGLGADVRVMALRSPLSDDFAHRYRLLRYGRRFRGAHRLGLNRWSAGRLLARSRRRLPPDVVNFHGVAWPPRFALDWVTTRRIPVVMTPHGEDIQRVPDIGYGLRLDRAWDARIRDHLRRADAVTAISDSVREELDFVDPERIWTVPNGIRLDRFRRRPGRYLHERLGLDAHARIVLSVGRNHPKKGYEDGLRAFAALTARCPDEDLHYVLLGGGVGALAPQAERLDLAARVHLLDPLRPEALVEAYNSAWLFFSPSIVEGLSLVSIEAMACGLPLVVTDVPGNCDVARDNDCGRVVPAGDAEAMAAGLRALLDGDERDRLAGRAARAAGRYDWSRIAGRYLSVYEHVIGRRSRPA